MVEKFDEYVQEVFGLMDLAGGYQASKAAEILRMSETWNVRLKGMY